MSATKKLRGKLHKSEGLVTARTLLVMKAENIYWNTVKMHKMKERSSVIKQLLETLFLAIKMCTGFTTAGICMNTLCDMCSVTSESCMYLYIDSYEPILDALEL